MPPCRNKCGINLVRMPATAETGASSSLNFSVEMLNSGVPGAAGCNEVIYLLKDLTRHGPDPSFLKCMFAFNLECLKESRVSVILFLSLFSFPGSGLRKCPAGEMQIS